MSSIKTLIPPGVLYRRHLCVCMYVDIQLSFISFPSVIFLSME